MKLSAVFAKLVELGINPGLVFCLPLLLVGVAVAIGAGVYLRLADGARKAWPFVVFAEYGFVVVLSIAGSVIMGL